MSLEFISITLVEDSMNEQKIYKTKTRGSKLIYRMYKRETIAVKRSKEYWLRNVSEQLRSHIIMFNNFCLFVFCFCFHFISTNANSKVFSSIFTIWDEFKLSQNSKLQTVTTYLIL